MNQKEQLYSIQQISSKLNIPKPTLRFWEKKFESLLQPLRTHGGQRRYTPEHVSIIEEIKMLKRAGLSLIEIKAKLEEGQMSEVGKRRAGDENTDGIDLLVERVAEVVKIEVLRYLQRKDG